MSNANFSSRYEATLMTIEDAIENSGENLDYESVNDILTLTCPDGSVIIITRQSATSQLWLAARSGGFHFDMGEKEEDDWVCDSDGETLAAKLAAICKAQGGMDIDFS